MRFTLGKTTTEEGIDKLLRVFPGIVRELRGISPVNLNAEDFKEFLSEANKKISIGVAIR